MSAWVRGNLLWKGRIFKKKSEIPQNDLTKPNIEGQVWIRAKAEERLLSQLSCHTIYDEFEYQGRLYREFCADFFHSGENLSLWLERYEPWLKHLSTITMTSA